MRHSLGYARRLRSAATLAVVVLTGGIMLAPAAFAQPQSKGQAKCLNAMVKRAAKLVKAQGREIDRCTYEAAANGGLANACLSADPNGKIAAATQKLIATETKSCSETPDFGYVGATVLAQAATAHRIAFVERSTSVGYLPSSDADCARVFLKGAGKIFATKLSLFARCLKRGLADSTIQSSNDVAACMSVFDGTSEPKIVKALASLTAKMAKSGCDSTTIPVCQDDVDRCADQASSCHGCEMLRIGGDLSVDCDLVDGDGGSQLSCESACGDSEVGIAQLWEEECDDGNRTSGDGCDYNCTPTGCGNGVTSPGEICDAAYGSLYGGICVGGTNDGAHCAWNAECLGGYCTSCPYRQSCLPDCSGCIQPPICVGLAPSIECYMYTGTCIGQGCIFTPLIACDDPFCGTQGNCTINGYCVPARGDECAEYEGVPGNCTLGY